MNTQQQQTTAPTNSKRDNDVFDVVIIGGGVVGLAILRAATLAGHKCAVIERDSYILSGASSGNSGIVCTGVDAAPGSLERALIRDSISQIRPFLQEQNIPYRECGSLVCEWDGDQITGDALRGGRHFKTPLSKVFAESIDAGDSNARRLNTQEVGELEPNVSTLCRAAVHIPGEIVVDSWLFSVALAVHARENGAIIYTDFAYDPEATWWDEEDQLWTIKRRPFRDGDAPEFEPPMELKAKAVVNAAGIYADLVQKHTKGVRPPQWTAKPRRGQYCVFFSDNVTHLTRPIQPIPTQRTKGVFVYSTLYDHIVVGPTALDQKSREDRKVDKKVGDELVGVGIRVLPDLDPETQFIGEFVGIRPATDKRDYQIFLSAIRPWVAVAGIRSTGLTASLGIGRHVVNLLESVLPVPTKPGYIRTAPLPHVRDLINVYKSNSDGLVMIHGHIYKVTHPLTRFGWESETGIARPPRERKARL